MNVIESFEIAAATFQEASGHLAPGKDGCTHSIACLHDWDIWCAAIEYMKRCRSRINTRLVPEVTIEQIERLKASNTELLASLKEMRDAAAAMARVIVGLEGMDQLEIELGRAIIENGFGKRADDLIAKVEGK